MRPTFFGFESARSGLTAAQAGLDTTGNNIANMSTEGYSRQVVDQTSAYLGSASDKVAAYSQQFGGLGATVNGIDQVRSQFLDLRYRDANADNSANDKMLSILTDIENNFDETQNDGLSAMLNDFNTQLQVLSLNAGVVEYSSLARSSAQKVAQTLNQYSTQLSAIRKQTADEMDISVKDANTLLDKIDTINQSIKTAQLQGDRTNELNDTRNRYLDELSKYMNIKATYHMDGTLSISSGSTTLLDAQAGTVATLSLDDGASGMRLLADGNPMTLTGGSLFGSMQVLNGKGSFAGAGENDFRGLPYYQASLDALANSLSGDLQQPQRRRQAPLHRHRRAGHPDLQPVAGQPELHHRHAGRGQRQGQERQHPQHDRRDGRRQGGHPGLHRKLRRVRALGDGRRGHRRGTCLGHLRDQRHGVPDGGQPAGIHDGRLAERGNGKPDQVPEGVRGLRAGDDGAGRISGHHHQPDGHGGTLNGGR
ncbi:MAG: flagellar hook-associated protein FlgK [Minicystis sp.]